MPIKTYLQQNLAKRVLISFFLFSIVLTTVSTIFILLSQYSNEKDGIISNTQALINTQSESISQILWNIDKPLAKISLTSLMTSANFTYIAIYTDTGDLFVSAGSENSKFSKIITKPLFFKNTLNNKKIKIGEIKAYISTASAKQHALENMLSVILIQTIKAIITSLIFLLLIYHLVIRHILALTKHILTKPLSSKLKLDRTYHDDELQLLVDTVNKSRKKRHKIIKTINKDNSKLAKEVQYRKKAENKAQASKEQLLYVLNSLTKSVFFCKEDGEILFMNHMALKMLNHHDAVSSTTNTTLFINDVISFTESNDIGSNKISLNIEKGNAKYVSKLTAYHIPPDEKDTLTPVQINLIPTKTNTTSQANGFIVIISDLTNKEKLEKMSYIATHDHLTNLYNRMYLETKIKKAIKTKNEAYSVAIIDLDKFKPVNDTCGHQTGDILLQLVAKTLQATIQPNDVLARIGGDEFAILFNADTAASKITAEKIITNIENMNFTHEEKELPISCSIGITEIKPSDKKLTDIFARADNACYQVKNNGRGSVKVHEYSVAKLKTIA